jgi:hypothetical protein
MAPEQETPDPFMTDLQQRADASNISTLRYLAIAEGETPLAEDTKARLREVAAGIFAASLRYVHPTTS